PPRALRHHFLQERRRRPPRPHDLRGGLGPSGTSGAIAPDLIRGALRRSSLSISRRNTLSLLRPPLEATMSNEPRRAGRHFLQIPGPTPVPDRILRAMDMPVIDHRGPEFKKLGLKVLAGIRTIFKTTSPVVIYPSSGTGAWEAALLNTLSPGDKVLMYETGHFATLWKAIAVKLGLQPEFIASDWRSGADAAAIEARLKDDKAHTIKAVCVVHNETSTGATSRIDEVRRAIDAARHPALLMVDTISSL